MSRVSGGAEGRAAAPSDVCSHPISDNLILSCGSFQVYAHVTDCLQRVLRKYCQETRVKGMILRSDRYLDIESGVSRVRKGPEGWMIFRS